MKLPKRIFVRMEKDGKEEFPIAFKELADCDQENETVGIYELVESGTLKIEHRLEAKGR